LLSIQRVQNIFVQPVRSIHLLWLVHASDEMDETFPEIGAVGRENILSKHELRGKTGEF
jgi:hypothetical protein